MSFVANLVNENMAAVGEPRRPHYERILRHCYANTPPFARRLFGVRYHELSSDPEWFANSLVANAALEGYGASQIWKFANRLNNQRYAAAVRQHSIDESRHSSMFVRMLELTFPDLTLDDHTQDRIDGLQPRYTWKNHPPIVVPASQTESDTTHWALNELIQVHITEIRALILQHLLRPVLLAYAPVESRGRLSSASNCLIRDETRHIGYSAAFFDAAARSGEEDFLVATFEANAVAFNELTLEELERDRVEI
jgi:hypothetical protein